jgi:hypothetical protein
MEVHNKIGYSDSKIHEPTGWIYYTNTTGNKALRVNGKLRMTDVISAGINYDTQVIVEYGIKNQPFMYVYINGNNPKPYKSNLDIDPDIDYFLCLSLSDQKYVLVQSSDVKNLTSDYVLCAMFQQFLSSTEVLVHIWGPNTFLR